MACLYIDAEGNERTRHSYSAGVEFDHSPLKYWLHRVHGWKPKDTNAALIFGRALEDAIEFFHKTSCKKGICEDEFIRLWVLQKDKPLKFAKKEVSWDHLFRCGREMSRLYEIRQPQLPIPADTVFQRAFTKEVFPDNPRYGGIEFYAKLDMIARAPADHPMLRPVDWKPEYGLFRPVIVDIKTSVNNLSDIPGIVGQDMQLRQYAWARGKQVYNWIDVAFLWFTKCGHKLQKGVSVTLLADAGRFRAGEEAVVASVEKGTGKVYLVGNDLMIEQMDKAQGYREGTESLDTTKDAKAKAAKWREENAVLVAEEDITRQRMQFNAGIVTWASAEDAGRIVADQIVRIVNAHESNIWTNTFSIRFPHNDVKDPYFQAFVLRDNLFRDTMFEQKAEEDLSDYFDEPEADE